jgi:hypothetical protein
MIILIIVGALCIIGLIIVFYKAMEDQMAGVMDHIAHIKDDSDDTPF